MRAPITGATSLAGVVGAPIGHSLSPLIHNAWLAESKIDAVYLAFEPTLTGFERFLDGLRGGVVRGVNVTAPFKERALAIADHRSQSSDRSGAANLLLFPPNGQICADNTDGAGLVAALACQASNFSFDGSIVVILGAGGAARGAAATVLDAGAAEVRIVNRGLDRARRLIETFGSRARCFSPSDMHQALYGANLLINAASTYPEESGRASDLLTGLPALATVMDMNYRPLRTPLLDEAAARGYGVVDGLAMLIGQAAPSFRALFGAAPPSIDVRSLALAALGAEV